ncbi:MAG: 6,7-dimethyl-8-ribityllumazine synthase [Candidatus Levybacteria bacterium]|nr:6,7-dimethyl-8-ribityllumazine synthase [Candidatus Levybacteria bacterium]
MKKENVRVAIVGSNYNAGITDSLEKHCVDKLLQNGVSKENISSTRVPGSLELPLAVKKLAKKKMFDAIIVFGAIHKGETYHFELISEECIRGCMNVSWEYEIPVIFEVLAVYDLKDAWERATRVKENRGVEAAETALSMIEALSKI